MLIHLYTRSSSIYLSMTACILGEGDIVTDAFLGVIPVSDVTSTTFYQSVVKLFAENNILYTEYDVL